MFIDEAEITIKAGDGGNGVVTFRREKYIPKGGPDGGNGGDGGNIFFVGVSDLSALKRFRYKKDFEAQNGGRGKSRKKTGGKGKDLVLYVPIGTKVQDNGTKEVFEILTVGQKVMLSEGGRGGRGNFEFRSSSNTTPRQFESGGRGRKRSLALELQLIADVGLVGLPNAGKSSLLNALTQASARVANYPFTTLEPNLGVISFGSSGDRAAMILADIPGLIEGAAKGKGLGHKFLRHVKRTKVLAHCISVESQDLQADYQKVKKELANFDKNLANKDEIILLTKIDLIEEREVKTWEKKLSSFSKQIVPCSIYQEDTLKNVRFKLLGLR